MHSRNNVPVVVKDLDWCFQSNRILEGINLKFNRGKFYSIIGPNGSGKTTLLRNISKSLFPQKECVFVQGEDIVCYGNKEFAKELSYVPQDSMAELDFWVLDMVLMGRNPYLRRFQAESQEDLTIAMEAMKLTNTWALKDKRFSEISGGERQRVVIARALAQQTGIVLLDEPISNLDILHQVEIMDIMKELVVSSNTTVIAVLHDLNIASLYSDEVILIQDGKVFLQGHPVEVITERNIERVYGIQVHIMKHPYSGRPQLVHLVKGRKPGVAV